ncbi:hypothetical protein HK101_004039 [Irineochytrium annulatum]|nr:hypothetical protein HK101_004039 [Irineochytrium annulatum]
MLFTSALVTLALMASAANAAPAEKKPAYTAANPTYVSSPSSSAAPTKTIPAPDYTAVVPPVYTATATSSAAPQLTTTTTPCDETSTKAAQPTYSSKAPEKTETAAKPTYTVKSTAAPEKTETGPGYVKSTASPAKSVTYGSGPSSSAAPVVTYGSPAYTTPAKSTVSPVITASPVYGATTPAYSKAVATKTHTKTCKKKITAAPFVASTAAPVAAATDYPRPPKKSSTEAAAPDTTVYVQAPAPTEDTPAPTSDSAPVLVSPAPAPPPAPKPSNVGYTADSKESSCLAIQDILDNYAHKYDDSADGYVQMLNDIRNRIASACGRSVSQMSYDYTAQGIATSSVGQRGDCALTEGAIDGAGGTNLFQLSADYGSGDENSAAAWQFHKHGLQDYATECKFLRFTDICQNANILNNYNWAEFGHFTALLWGSANAVGVATKHCGGGGALEVMKILPNANIVGQLTI